MTPEQEVLRVMHWAARRPASVVVKLRDASIVAGSVTTVGVTFANVRPEGESDVRIPYSDIVEVRRRDGKIIWPGGEGLRG